MNDLSNTAYNAPTSGFREVRRGTSVIAFFLGMAIIAASIFLGRSYAFYISVVVFSVSITLLWRRAPRPWILLVSIVAATPIALFRQNVACNLIFAVWFIVFNMGYLFKLPKWIYVPVGLAIIGFLTSSINWLSDNITGSILRQSAYFFNFVLAPSILLPMIYFRMEKSRDNAANLQGLLFCLIVPSTLILISAKLFGTVANAWEASLHAESLSEGYLLYQLGKVAVSFKRTEVGFILAALICASTAIAVSRVKTLYKLLAGACLAPNTFLLLATGSFGSIFACLCGLAAIFYTQFRTISVTKVLVSVAAICCMLLMIYSLSPPSVKEYLEKRYEHRVVERDADRLVLWARAMDSFLKHPEGVGLTLTVGDEVKSNPHNDYIAYTVSYGVIGGLAYVSLVTGLLIYFFKSRKRGTKDNSALAITLAGQSVIVACAVNSMTDNICVSRWYFNVIWSVIWYSYFCGRAVQMGAVRDGIGSEIPIAGTTGPGEKSL